VLVLFDQGTPVPLRSALTKHVVSTAFERRWSELKSRALLVQCILHWKFLTVFDHATIGQYSSHMKVNEVLRMLDKDGWFLVATRGSHRQLKHPTKPGRVTVPGRPGDDLAPGTLNSILKQAGLKQ
jgi:predicted RNA binding protein YcfA (HicA-like mRNA interferase family)